MKECFDYQASSRLDMTFNTHITEKYNLFIYLLFIIIPFLGRIKAFKRNLFIYQDKNKGKEKG